MYIGTQIQERIEEVVRGMVGNSVEFEFDTMKFLVVKDKTEEAKKLLQGGKITIIPPLSLENQKFLVFNL